MPRRTVTTEIRVPGTYGNYKVTHVDGWITVTSYEQFPDATYGKLHLDAEQARDLIDALYEAIELATQDAPPNDSPYNEEAYKP